MCAQHTRLQPTAASDRSTSEDRCLDASSSPSAALALRCSSKGACCCDNKGTHRHVRPGRSARAGRWIAAAVHHVHERMGKAMRGRQGAEAPRGCASACSCTAEHVSRSCAGLMYRVMWCMRGRGGETRLGEWCVSIRHSFTSCSRRTLLPSPASDLCVWKRVWH